MLITLHLNVPDHACDNEKGRQDWESYMLLQTDACQNFASPSRG